MFPDGPARLERPDNLEMLEILEILGYLYNLKNTSFSVRICHHYSGGYSVGVPPLPIPNREVKPVRADGTAHPWESR